jgi:hypothetical protein
MERRYTAQTQNHRESLIKQQMAERIARAYRIGVAQHDFGALAIYQEVGQADITQHEAVLVARGPHPRLPIRQAGLEQPITRLANFRPRLPKLYAQFPGEKRWRTALSRLQLRQRNVATNRQPVSDVTEAKRPPGPRLYRNFDCALPADFEPRTSRREAKFRRQLYTLPGSKNRLKSSKILR